jgi:hypothetical protein
VDKLPRSPGWSCKKVTVRGNVEDEKGKMLQEEVELWSQDPVECVKELIGNPAFKEHMAYSPAKAYADHAGQHRVIDEMWTADWWGEKQVRLFEREQQSNGLTSHTEHLARGCNNSTNHSIFRQNIVVAVPRG